MDPISIQLGLSALVKEKLRQYFALLNGQKPVADFYNYILQEIERPLIEIVLEMTKGNKRQAANLLGINRHTLRKRMKELNIRDTQ